MSRTLLQNDQVANLAQLPSLGAAAMTQNLDIFSAIEKNFDQPLRMSAGFPTADTKLYFSANLKARGDGTSATTPPSKSNIPSVSASWIDFQSQSVSGATFDVTWPASTVGQFRRAGFTLISNGSIKVLFSAEAASVGALANPGTLFVKSEVPLGYVDLECTNVLGYFKTAGSATSIIENAVGGTSRVIIFGSGGGAGGSGDANFLLERYFSWADVAPFEFMGANIIGTDGSTKIASATAAYNIVEGSYDFAASTAQNLVSTQVLDSEFLALGEDVGIVEVLATWLDTNVDGSATYEISRDGGSNYQTLSMARVGSADTFRALHQFADTETNQAIDDYNVSNADSTLALDNSTNQRRSQPFTIASGTKVIKQVVGYFNRTGVPAGYYQFQIVRDSSGNPSTSALDVVGSSELALLSGLTWTADNATATVNLYAVLPAGTYHLVVLTSGYTYSAGVTELKVRTDQSAPGKTNTRTFNGTSWSAGSPTACFVYAINGRPLDLRFKVTSSVTAGIKKLIGHAVAYRAAGVVATGIENEQRFSITSNTNSFSITSFMPSPDKLKCYVAETGQVFRAPAFSISGFTVNFPANTFASASVSNPLTLIFDQSEGGGFDNSDKNGSLLGDNRLGSMSAILDKSVSGEGPILKAATGAGPLSGKRCEIWLDSYGNIQVSSLE